MSTSTDVHTFHGKGGKVYVAASMFSLIDKALAFMRLVLYGKETYYKQKQFCGATIRVVSDLGGHCDSLEDYFTLYSSQATFHPALTFFFEEWRKRLVDLNSALEQGTVIAPKGRVEGFNEFVAKLRRRAVETGLKKRIHDWESKVKKNWKRIQEFEKQLFERCGRVLVIRLDLHYHAAKFSKEELVEFLSNESRDRVAELSRFETGDETGLVVMEGRVAFDEVHRDRTRLFANMKGKRSLFKALVGYAWRIEWTPLAGYHLHTAFMFNAAEVNPIHHKDLAQRIGRYWKDQVTKGRGYFHSCNNNWDPKHPKYAIGVIEHSDVEKRAQFRKAVLGYLTKDSQAVQVLPFKGCNGFGCGFVHQDRSKGRGRPRTKGLDAVERCAKRSG